MEADPEASEDSLKWRVSVKRKDVSKILTNIDEIKRVFGVHLCTEDKVSNKSSTDLVWLQVIPDNTNTKFDADLITRLQRYVESTACGEEDSSYDSDCEEQQATNNSRGHDDVSRTTSDTLGAEFAEYVSGQQAAGYAQRVEFALKLGYTERHVQAALAKLGPNPTQNELLAELIRLGSSPHLLPADFETLDDHHPDDPNDDQVDDEPSNITSGPVPGQLRHIVIDGSNVAMSHGNKERFSCRGIKICVDWFRSRGHKDITVFVPRWRKEASRPERPITDQEILNELERERLLVFTPSRLVGGKRVACYDDRYVLKLAAETEGIVVSNDNYRDLVSQCPEFRRVVEERILMYSFVNDKFMPPDDPLGRTGPTLDNFLRVSGRTEPPRPCPYGKKCTYGNKCKYAHPERGPLPHKSVSERLAEQHAQRQQARSSCRDHSPGDQLKGKSLSLPPSEAPRKIPLSRTRSLAPSNAHLQQQVCKSRSVESVRHLQWAPEWLQGGHVAVAKQLSDPPAAPPPQASEEPVNLHRKLQRQLTLNPAYDARLCHLQHPGYPGNSGFSAEHRPLTRHSSDYRPAPYMPTGWEQHMGEQHQSVTRIASAPEPLPPRWPTAPPPQHHMLAQRLTASSEPNLMWPAPNPQGERSRICYHLSSIFPVEQVQAAMRCLPDETNPQKICAAILEMFGQDNTH